MAKSAGYYNVDDFNNYKRAQGKCLPPRINVLAAANHIQALFDAKKLTYGFMGGIPMLCLGYKREMPDLHIAYDAREFERLRAKLESDRRYVSSDIRVTTSADIVQNPVTKRLQLSLPVQSPYLDGPRVQRSGLRGQRDYRTRSCSFRYACGFMKRWAITDAA